MAGLLTLRISNEQYARIHVHVDNKDTRPLQLQVTYHTSNSVIQVFPYVIDDKIYSTLTNPSLSAKKKNTFITDKTPLFVAIFFLI